LWPLPPYLRPEFLQFRSQFLDRRGVRFLGGLGVDQGGHGAMHLGPQFRQVGGLLLSGLGRRALRRRLGVLRKTGACTTARD
jgi:hypothetical protein